MEWLELGLPEALHPHLKGQIWARSDIGRSACEVFLLSGEQGARYLKLTKNQGPAAVELRREAMAMTCLRDRLPVPQVICFAENEHWLCLLTAALPGRMVCDDTYLVQPELAVAVLAAALRQVHEAPREVLSFSYTLQDKLNIAGQRVAQNLVEREDWEPETAARFATPQTLLRYLESHRPHTADLVVTHGDFCLPNVLGVDEEPVGLCDLGGVGLDDPWQDIALCLRSLHYNLGTDAYDEKLLEALQCTMDVQRYQYYLLLDELF